MGPSNRHTQVFALVVSQHDLYISICFLLIKQDQSAHLKSAWQLGIKKIRLNRLRLLLLSFIPQWSVGSQSIYAKPSYLLMTSAVLGMMVYTKNHIYHRRGASTAGVMLMYMETKRLIGWLPGGALKIQET